MKAMFKVCSEAIFTEDNISYTRGVPRSPAPGDIVKVTDGSWAVELRDGGISADNSLASPHDHEAVARNRWKVLASGCTLPSPKVERSGYDGLFKGFTNDLIISNEKDGIVAFTHSKHVQIIG